MIRFANLLEQLIFTKGRNDKITHIKAWIKSSNKEDLGWGLAAICDELKLPKIKPSSIKKIIISHVDKKLFELSYDYIGDLAETVALIWPKSLKNKSSKKSLSNLISDLSTSEESDVEKIIEKFMNIFDHNTRWAFLKLITGGMRVGVSSRLAKIALSESFDVSVSEVEEVWYAVNPPYKELIDWLYGDGKKPNLNKKAIFRPPMLANPLHEKDYKIISSHDFIAEWKWDGIRIQLVSNNGKCKMFSRSGDDISKSFPDIVSYNFKQDFNIDGELMIGDIDNLGSFNDLQQRLNRKSPSKKIILEYPVFIIAYDLLIINDEDQRQKNILTRRKNLSSFLKKQPFPFVSFSNDIKFENFDDLNEMRLSCRQDSRYEGLMIKKKKSTYVNGRPKGLWFKFKREPYVIDVVLLYAQRGHGKRSSLYSDFTFGVWTKNNGANELVTVGKAYSGFTDKELYKLDNHIRKNTINRYGPVREVKKELVLEVAFDDIHISKRHKSGVAMRFPRIKRIRWDKPAVEADNLNLLKEMVK